MAGAVPVFGQLPAKTPVSGGIRPAPAERRFTSAAVESYIAQVKTRIGDPLLATLFENWLPEHARYDGAAGHV